MDHEELQENLSLYALGTLEPESAQEVEAHLASGCPNCGTILTQFQTTAALLPSALPPKTPPADAKRKIFARLSKSDAPPASAPTAWTQLRQTADIKPAATPSPTAAPEEIPAKPSIPTAPPDMMSSQAPWTKPAHRDEQVAEPAPETIRRRPSSAGTGWLPSALAASLALVAGAGVYAYYLFTTLENERASFSKERAALADAKTKMAEMDKQLAAKQREAAKASSDLNRAISALGTTHELLAKNQEQIEILQASKPGKSTEEILRIFSSPYAKMATLNGTQAARDAYALIFLEPDTHRGFFYANNLPALPAGKTYQLWIITDKSDKPASAGVFSLDHGRKGRIMLRDMPDASRIKQFAVSIEPEGGRPQPTGGIYLAGNL